MVVFRGLGLGVEEESPDMRRDCEAVRGRICVNWQGQGGNAVELILLHCDSNCVPRCMVVKE